MLVDIIIKKKSINRKNILAHDRQTLLDFVRVELHCFIVLDWFVSDSNLCLYGGHVDMKSSLQQQFSYTCASGSLSENLPWPSTENHFMQ